MMRRGVKVVINVKNIDCCIGCCMLFYENDFNTNYIALEEFKFYQSLRYYIRCISNDRRQKRVVVKSIFYMTIIPIFPEMFASMHNASQMRRHHTNKTSSNMLQHPSDGEARNHFDRVYPEFTIEFGKLDVDYAWMVLLGIYQSIVNCIFFLASYRYPLTISILTYA